MPVDINQEYYEGEPPAQEAAETPAAESAEQPPANIQLTPDQMQQVQQLASSGQFEQLGRLIAGILGL